MPSSEMKSVKELFDLSGQTAIVTGGGSGIGRQMAGALAELGADLVICARNLERCQQAAAELAQVGVRTLALRCDLRQPGDAQAVVDTTVREFGRVDVLVNDAGTTWGAPAEDTPLQGWQKVIDVNLTGLFFMTQAVARRMIAQGGGGAIVNIASVAGIQGSPPGMLDAVAYSASKGGVITLTRDLAWKWAGMASASTPSHRAGSRPTCRRCSWSGMATSSSSGSPWAVLAAPTT